MEDSTTEEMVEITTEHQHTTVTTEDLYTTVTTEDHETTMTTEGQQTTENAVTTVTMDAMETTDTTMAAVVSDESSVVLIPVKGVDLSVVTVLRFSPQQGVSSHSHSHHGEFTRTVFTAHHTPGKSGCSW